MKCPECNRTLQVPARSERRFVHCPDCNNIVDLRRRPARDDAEEPVPESLQLKIDRPPVRASTNYRGVETTASRFEASFRWVGPATKFTTFFAILWNLFIIPFCAIAIFSGELLLGLFMTPFLAAGTWLTWSALSGWRNTSTVKIEDGVLSCTHAPIPKLFGKAESVALDDVNSFRVERREQGSGNGKKYFKWFVVAELSSGKAITVTDGLGSPAAAKYLERKLERHRLDSDEALAEYEKTEEGAPLIQDQSPIVFGGALEKVSEMVGAPSAVQISSEESEEDAEVEELARERRGTVR